MSKETRMTYATGHYKIYDEKTNTEILYDKDNNEIGRGEFCAVDPEGKVIIHAHNMEGHESCCKNEGTSFPPKPKTIDEVIDYIDVKLDALEQLMMDRLMNELRGKW